MSEVQTQDKVQQAGAPEDANSVDWKAKAAELEAKLKEKESELLSAQTALASEEFLEWMENRDKKKADEPVKAKTVSKGDLDDMTGSELAEYIIESVVSQVEQKLGSTIESKISAEKMAMAQRKFDAFKKLRPDWVNYQAEMQVLSLKHPEIEDPMRLYEMAKEWRAPKTVRVVETEKPFLSMGADDFEPETGLSPVEAAKKAIRAVLGRKEA